MTSSVLHLTVNGTPYELAAPNRRTLVDLLRYELGLTGTKEACSVGVCGVCSVLLDGRLVASCLLLACQADGHAITSIEGVTAPNGELHPLQQSFIDHAGFQCGSSRLNTWAGPSAMWNSLLEVPAVGFG